MVSDGSGRPVYDFSLGNPTLSPPPEFDDLLRSYVAERPIGAHAYMHNAGYEETRAKVALSLTRDHQCAFTAEHILMTVGAAGAVNIALKALLDFGDEVIVSAPHFVEYGYYAANHGGELVTVNTTPQFDLDVSAIINAVTAKTKVVIITNPNNPTGKMYPQDTLNQLGAELRDASLQVGHPIYLLDDAPYRKLVYDVARCTSSFDAYEYTLMATSHSKDLSLPGERIGFLALSPKIENHKQLQRGCAFAARILGFINAPALMQRMAAELQEVTIDLNWYRKRRDRLVSALTSMGYDVPRPDGAFYLFPKVPFGTDYSFVDRLKKYRVLTVPGIGFGTPGYFRIAYCVSEITIEESLSFFEKAIRT